MSRDLRVVGNKVAPTEGLTSWISGVHRWEVIGETETMWVRPGRAADEDIGFSISAPLAVGFEDLPPDLAASVVSPKWAVEVNVPLGTSEEVWDMAMRVGRRLADEMAGVVYDPQEDSIVWPRSKRRRVLPRGGPRQSDVEFEWAVPAGRFVPGLSSEVLETLRAVLPEATPTRFGAFEPLQHRLDEGNERFDTLWEEERAAWVGMLFWRASPPVRMGMVFFPHLRPPPRGIAAGSMSITVDGRVFDRSEWRDLAASLLDQVGGLTGAFCARAHVQQSLGGTMTASEVMAAPPALVVEGAWIGLADHPSWLTWLPPAYLTEIGDGLARQCETGRHGSVLALSERPARDVELLPWLDRFPASSDDRRRAPKMPNRGNSSSGAGRD